MFRLIRKIIRRRRLRTLYVLADPVDNSVTLSRGLFRRMRVSRLSQAKVYVFHVPADRCYAFTLNPPFADRTQVADIMYNTRYRTVGFESLCPSVCRILYDYGTPTGAAVRLSVEPAVVHGITIYKILPPAHD